MPEIWAKALDAVLYVLNRAQTDPDLGYLIGPGTEAFERLCIAEAEATGLETLEQVKRRRGQPVPGRKAKVFELEERIKELEDELEDKAEELRAHNSITRQETLNEEDLAELAREAFHRISGEPESAWGQTREALREGWRAAARALEGALR